MSIRLLQVGRLINFLDKFLNFANAGNLKQPPQFDFSTNTPLKPSSGPILSKTSFSVISRIKKNQKKKETFAIDNSP